VNPALAIAAIAAGIGILLGGGAAHLYYSPRLDLERARVEQRDEKIKGQNSAVDALKAQGEQRKADAARAIDAASKIAQGREQRAAELLATPAPAGDDCKAIDALLVQGLGK
jgi:hypothetical protein